MVFQSEIQIFHDVLYTIINDIPIQQIKKISVFFEISSNPQMSGYLNGLRNRDIRHNIFHTKFIRNSMRFYSKGRQIQSLLPS